MSNKNIVEDILSLGSGILSGLVDARHELKAQARQHVGAMMRDLDLVSREEFNAAFAMLAKAREMQEDLEIRLKKIEEHLHLSSAKNKVKAKKINLPSVKTRGRRHKNK